MSAPSSATSDGPAVDPSIAPEAIKDEVARLITEVVGEEYLLDIAIDLTTSFNEDLEIESLEFVGLAEKLTERYGERVDFVGWFAELDLEEIIDLTVGDLVDFIHGRLTA